MSFKVLAIGDKFIPSSYYQEVFANLKSKTPELADVELITVEWNADKFEQHRLQQIMEWEGANAVETPPEILEAVEEVDAICMHFAPIGKAVIEASAKLSLVVAARAGLENVDLETAKARGVEVSGVQGRNASAVAELAIGLMLSECRNISRADSSIKSGGWRKEFPVPMVEIGDSKIGIIGWGQVAQRLGEKLRGLAGTVMVHDPYADAEDIKTAGAIPASFEEIFRESDFVHIMARLTKETERFVGKQEFSMMKPSAYFINTARSRLVDYEALFDALKTKSIAGAGLDVFDDEPLTENSPWRDLDNVTMTTHYGGDTIGTNRTSARLVMETIANLRKA